MRERRPGAGTSGGRVVLIVAATITLATLGAAEGADNRLPDSGRIDDAPWATHLRILDEALAARDVRAAERAWREAYVAAAGSWRWDGMLAVGDAALRVGQVAVTRHAAQARARNVYLAALFRARQQDSVDGVLRAAEAFAALGDRDVVEQCLRLAGAMASQARDSHASARVHALTARLAAIP